jgi:hypothetical protein
VPAPNFRKATSCLATMGRSASHQIGLFRFDMKSVMTSAFTARGIDIVDT